MIKFVLRLFLLREVDDETGDLFLVQSRGEKHRQSRTVVTKEIFFVRRAGAERHQLLERFVVETMMFRRGQRAQRCGQSVARSEERRVGEERRSRRSPCHSKKNSR